MDICGHCNYHDCECEENELLVTEYLSDSITCNNLESINTDKSMKLYDDHNMSSEFIDINQNLSNKDEAATENNISHEKNDICMLERNVHENKMHGNISSMSAQSMLNLGLSKKGFNIGHLNIQGIQNKIDQLDLLLNSSQNILGLSESKLNSSHMNSFFDINNYQTFRKDRIISTDRPQHGGGLIVYVKDGVKCERRTDLECERIECVRLEFFPTNSKSFLVGNIYRGTQIKKLAGMSILKICVIKFSNVKKNFTYWVLSIVI